MARLVVRQDFLDQLFQIVRMPDALIDLAEPRILDSWRLADHTPAEFLLKLLVAGTTMT